MERRELKHPGVVAALLAAAAAVAYLSNFRLSVSSDATPHVLTAASWLRQGDPFLDEYVGVAAMNGQVIGGHFLSWYPPGTPLLIAPFLLPILAVGADPASAVVLAVLGRTLGVLAASLSVAFVYLACRELTSSRAALIASVGYAFGTSTWAVSSQNVWQHGPSQLLVAIGTYLLASSSSSALAGLAYGVATLVRPTDALVAASGALTSARRGARSLWRYLAWGAPALALLLVYDAVAFGSPLTQSYPPEPWVLQPSGYLGLLVSPSRGLFVYSPFLLWSLYGFALAWRRAAGRATSLLRDASLAVAGVWLVHGSIAFWWGGWTYGNRYLADVLPLFALALAFAIERGALRPAWSRVAFGVGLAWSVALQFVGASYYYRLWVGRHWDVTPNIDATPWRLWDWADPQWAFVLRHAVAAPDALLVVAFAGATVSAALVAAAAAR